MGLLNFFKGSKKRGEQCIPQNDTERWAIATYAIWTEWCGGNCKYIGGAGPNISTDKILRPLRELSVTSRRNALGYADYYIYCREDTNAFDYGYAANMVALYFLLGYLSRKEMLEQTTKLATEIRKRYHSWDEYTTAFIINLPNRYADKKAEFEVICKRLQAMPDGPYTVAWEL